MHSTLHRVVLIAGIAVFTAPAFAQMPVRSPLHPWQPHKVYLGSPTRLYSVGGGFSMIFGGGLVLELNNSAYVTISSNAPFQFPLALRQGAGYDVEIKTQPPGQACTLSGNRGVIANQNVTSVSVNCQPTVPTYDLSVQATGLRGSGLLVTDGFNVMRPVNQVASFGGGGLAMGSPYAITITAQPTNPVQVCAITANGSGIVSRTSILHPAQVVCR